MYLIAFSWRSGGSWLNFSTMLSFIIGSTHLVRSRAIYRPFFFPFAIMLSKRTTETKFSSPASSAERESRSESGRGDSTSRQKKTRFLFAPCTFFLPEPLFVVVPIYGDVLTRNESGQVRYYEPINCVTTNRAFCSRTYALQ